MSVTSTVAPVSAVADVLALWGSDGWLTPPLLPVVAASEPVMGAALTISIAVGSRGPGLAPIYTVLSGDLRGRVVVIAGAAGVPGAVWGEILTRAARQQGAAAVVIDGWVRDVPEMAELGLPVCALGTAVVGPHGHAQLGAVGGAVSIGSVALASGDPIVVDAGGCVRIPAGRATEVLAAAQQYADAERRVCDALAAGDTLAAAYAHKQSILDELRR